MKYLSILFVLCLASIRLFATGGYITISSIVPSNITICGQTKVFSFTISNPSAFNLTSVTVNLTMPTGINYQIGSVTNATTSVSTSTNNITFNLSNIPANSVGSSAVIVTYTASANCDVLNYLSLGLPIDNKIIVNYTANSNLCFDNHTSQVYLVKQPNVSITTVTNQSYNGAIGSTFTRCITISNGGTGELSSLSLTNTHGTGLSITGATPGAWTGAAGTETYALTGANFSSIGNNNNLLETGESITVCETVSITNCSSVFSSYTASWGCDGQSCQKSLSSANIVFPNFVPNLIFTPTPKQSSCLGSSTINQQTLTIVNTGQGKAINTKINIFQSSGLSFYPNLASEIDTASITIQINGAAITPIAVTSASLNNVNASKNCLPSGSIGAFDIIIPTINAGDQVILRWDTKSCCIAPSAMNGWWFKATYQSICLDNYLMPVTLGKKYTHIYLNNLVNNGSPSSITGGQTATFKYLLNSINMSNPVAADGYIKLTFTISPCYVYSPNSIKILTQTNLGVVTWTPTNVNQVGNLITAMFDGSTLTNAAQYSKLEQAQLLIDLTGDCTTCGSSANSIDVGFYYSTSAACSCEMLLKTASFPVNLVCPNNCEGLNFLKYEIKRTSYGLPDNNNDGLADAIGSIDFNTIKRNRAMFGDTLTSSFYAKVKTSATHPSWQFCYATSTFSTISNTKYLTSIGGQLKIYRGVGLPVFATCNISGVPVVSPASTFHYDLSASALVSSGGVAVGFEYLDNDSLVFEPQYKITTNAGGSILAASVTNTFVISDIANPVNAANLYSCNTFDGNFSIIGYYFANEEASSYKANNCDQVVISQSYHLSVGPCCSNYNGGNLFPYEYRNWAIIDTLKITPPIGYKYVAASFREIRTAGTFSSSISPTIFINPVNALANTLEFPVSSYFSGVSPIIPPSDDGFSGVLTATLEPSCNVVQNVSQNIRYLWTFNPSGYLPQTYSLTTLSQNSDIITYNGPSIFLQSLLPNLNATTNVVSWDISLSNISTPSASNVWISAPSISGVNINTIVDLATNATLTAVGGIYQLGTLPGGSLKNYRLFGSYTSCQLDSIVVYAGWNCQGYPTNLAAYPCKAQTITLKVTPQLPLLLTTVITPSSIVNLCDTSFYEIIGTNVQLGSAYNLTVSVNLPLNVTIIPGSSQLSYPLVNPYITVSDPIFIGGTIYQYNLSVLSSSIGLNGLPGILSIGDNAVKIKFKVITSCGYTSGSLASFSLFGNSGCGSPTGQLISLSSQLGITGATAPYLTNTVLKSTYISPCNANSLLRISTENLGGFSFGTSDSIQVTLPVGVSYVNNSFAGIHNSPLSAIPVISVYNNQQHLTWKLPVGVAKKDSTVFTISYSGNPSILHCNISNFEAKTTTSTTLLCTLTGSFCGVNVITGGDTLPIFTYKSYLALSNASGYSVPNAPSGETLFVKFNINNTGEALNSTNNTVVNYYNDVNSNGIYNTGDILITQHTVNISIPNNGTSVYNYSLNIPSGSACHIIAVIDTSNNHCSCTPSQISLNFLLKNLAKDTVLCNGQTALIGSDAITGYTYSWTPITNLNSATNYNPTITGVNNTLSTITTSYIVTVNRNTCISTDTAIIKIYPLPTVSATSKTICAGSLTTLVASGATSYTWDPSSTLNTPYSATVIANPTITTTYSITGSDINGCINTATTSIITLSLPTLTITPSFSVCSGLTETLTVGGATTYTWNSPTNLSSANGTLVTTSLNTTETYTATGELGGCINTAITTISVIATPTLIATSNTIICSKGSASLTVSGASICTWSPSGNLSASTGTIVIATPVNTTTYSVIGANSNCIDSTTIVVTVTTTPIITVNSETICSTASASLIANGGVTYSWSPSSFLNTSNGATVTSTPPSSITYTINSSSLLGCIGNTTVTVFVMPTPTIITTANPFTICSDSSTILNATGAINYTWSPSATLTNSITANTIASPLNTTTYFVIGTNGIVPNSCSSTQTIQVIVKPKIIPAVSPNDMICIGKSTTIFASGGNTYHWNPIIGVSKPNDSVTIVEPIVTTIYTVSVSKNNLCPVTASLQVDVMLLPIVNAGKDTTINIDQDIVLTGTGNVPVGFLSPNNLPLICNWCPIVTVYPKTTTCYVLEGYNTFGCRNTDEVCITVTKDYDLYIPNAFTPNEDETNDYFLPKGYGLEQIDLTIFDRWGNKIFEENNTIYGWDGKYKGKICSQGVYVYHIEFKTMAQKTYIKVGHLTILSKVK